jgi:hypothetical protein
MTSPARRAGAVPGKEDLWASTSSMHTAYDVDIGDTLTASLTGKYSMSPMESTHRRSKVASFGKALKNVPSKPRHDTILELDFPVSFGKQTLSHARSPSTVQTRYTALLRRNNAVS